MVNIAINGFGRIGRAFFKLAQKHKDLNVIAINDLADEKELKYLLKYDSFYGYFEADLDKVAFFREKDPENLPWKELDIDVVVECTGIFKTQSLAQKHILAGAKRVVVSAPSEDIKTILVGINETELKKHNITSNASCTTNAVAPVVSILDNGFGVQDALLTTVHAVTATQSLVDTVNKKDSRRGRSALLNIIPTSTGAAKALQKVHEITNFDALSLRVPVPVGSLVDLTVRLKKPASVKEINALLKNKSTNKVWRGLFAVSQEPVVSMDIVGRPKSSIADLTLTKQAGELVKVFAWYDNEIGYTASLVEHVRLAAEYL